MKKVFICLFILTVLIITATAENPDSNESSERPSDFLFIIGPRLGVNYINISPEEFSENVNEIFSDS